MQCSSLTSCSTFTPNYWAPAKCANCYKPEAAHTYTSVGSNDQGGGRRNIKLRTNLHSKADKRRNPHPTTSPSSSSPSISDVPVPPHGDEVPAGVKDDHPPTTTNDDDSSSRGRVLFFADGPKSDSDASLEGDPRGSAPEEEVLAGTVEPTVVPVSTPTKRDREVGPDGVGTPTVAATVVDSSGGGGGSGGGGEEEEVAKKLERKGSLSRMRHMVEKMVLKRKESREVERRSTYDGSSSLSAPPSPAPVPLVPTLVMTQRSQLLKLQALIDAELVSQFPHRTANDVGAALAELEPHLIRTLQRLAQPSSTMSPAPASLQQSPSKEKVVIINGMTHPEPLWPPPRSSTPSSPLVSVRLHTSDGEEGEAGEPQVLIRRGASRHDGVLLDDDSNSNTNGGLDHDDDGDDDVSSVVDFPSRPSSRRRGGEATMRSERRTPKSEGRPRSHSRAEREKPNTIDTSEEVVRPVVAEGGRPRSHSRVEREKPNILDEDQGRRHRSERGKKEQKVVVVVKEEQDDKEKKEDHDDDDDLEAWTASQQQQDGGGGGGGAKKRKGPPPRARSGSISGRVPQIEARIPPAITAAPPASASVAVSRRARSGSAADLPPIVLGGVHSPPQHPKGLASPRHGSTRSSPALSLSFELEVKEKKKEKEKKKKRSKSMGSKEEVREDKSMAASEEKMPTKMKKRWMTMRKMNSGKVPKAMSDTMMATRDEAEEQQQQQLPGGISEVGRKGAPSSLSGRSKSGPIARASKAKAGSPRVVRASSMDTGERRKVAPHAAAAGGGKKESGGSSKSGGGEDVLGSPSKKKVKKEKRKKERKKEEKKEKEKEKMKMKEKERRSSSEEDQRRIIFNRSQKLDI